MPEGDSLENLARWLGPALVGARLVGVWLRPHGEVTSLRGRTVASVAAIGKNLVVRFDDERSLIVHLGMYGRWRQQARGTRSSRAASVRIETEAAVFVCTRARRADLVASRWESRHPGLERLGPDLLDDECDMTAIVARARRSPAPTVGELLLDQRVAAGIGNVYKSEALFLEHTDPRRRPATLEDDALTAIYSRARELMRANLRPGGRITVNPSAAPQRVPKSERYWVYRRAGSPCRRCRSAIELVRQGDAARSSYFCPRCQPLEGVGGAKSSRSGLLN
jgi:endonuclease VIII